MPLNPTLAPMAVMFFLRVRDTLSQHKEFLGSREVAATTASLAASLLSTDVPPDSPSLRSTKRHPCAHDPGSFMGSASDNVCVIGNTVCLVPVKGLVKT